MTACNLIVQTRARAVFLLTDTAVIGRRTGKVVRFGPKTIPIHADGRAVAVLAVTGCIEPNELAEHLQTFQPASLGDFLERFPEVFRTAERSREAQGAAGSMAAVVAAFDHGRSLPLGFTIGNDHALFPCDQRPFELKKRKMHITEFDPDNLALRRTDFCDPRQWSPERDGEPLIEAQRRDMDETCGYYSIGGRAELTRLDANGITMKVLAEWPDRIGRRIAPYAGPGRGWRDRLETLMCR